MRKVFKLFLCLAWLAFAVSTERAQARRGMTPADTLRVAEVGDAQVSPDGEWVVYTVATTDGNARRTALWLVRTVGVSQPTHAGPVPVAPAPVALNTQGMSVAKPRWSPDGKRIAFLGTRGGQSGVWLMSLTERPPQPRLVAPVRETNFHIAYAGEPLAWSPDGRRLAFISATDDETDNTSGASSTVNTSPGTSPNIASSTSPGTSASQASSAERRDGPRVVTRLQYKSRTSFSDRARTHVFVFDLEESSPLRQLTQLTFGPHYDHALAWNPRGDEIAFLSNHESDPDAVNNSDIFAVDMQGRVRRLTQTRGCEYEPAWSPDGRWIAHTATTRDVTTIDSIAEDAHVWIVDSDGSSRREVSGALDRRARTPRWSPDSGYIFFMAGDRGRTFIFRVGVQGGLVRPLYDRFSLERTRDADTRDDAQTLPLLPFQTGSFTLSARSRPIFAFTLSDASRPAEVWIGDAGGERARRISAHNDGLMRSVALSEPEDFSFRSFDQTTVQGWLFNPVGFQLSASRPYPLILRIHGGPHGMYGYGFDPTAQAYAARGYAVLQINPRGSTGYGQKFSDGTFREWGGGDYRDLMAGVDEILRARSWIDPERMGVTGGSYGGFMTNWIITQTPRFRAAVASASVSNLVSFYSTSLYQDLLHAEFGGFPWDDYDILWRWSPLRYVRAAETPTLFIHGEQDNDVHITQAEEMYMALRRRGVESALVRYPREGHSLREPAHRLDALERTLAWFDRLLK
ncbi:MAG TPA: S9 family peptidase [Pyrinomonadaceae bacterium]|nr:S9 family peptidase [Pyrinomonadaceae bacterium]